MPCSTCGQPLFTQEREVGRCRACVRTETFRWKHRYNVGDIQFRQFGDEMVLLYHDALGQVSFVAPMERA